MTAQPTLRRHPIRGFLWGLVAGLGTVLLLMTLSVVPLSIPALATWSGISAVLGALWGTFGPARKPSAPAPGEAYGADGPDRDDLDIPGAR